jgi:RNA polymerase sigma-70 factor (ECF subfamily)
MEIWEEIKADPNAGAKRLVVEYGDRLYDAAVRLSLDEDVAQELVSRTLLRAIERIDLFQGGSTLYTWLYTILVNFWRMELRKMKSEKVVFTDELPDRPDESPDPFESLAAKADAQAIREAVGRLPAMYRAVTVFRYFEDMTVPEIARVVGIPEGTVKFRLHKAKAIMRRQLVQTIGAPSASKGKET